MSYVWRENTYLYTFKSLLEANRLDNKALFVDGPGLIAGRDLDDKMEDVIMLLLHGAASTNSGVPDIVKERCIVGSLIGNAAALEEFVRQRYLWVSRITGGATANTMGQIAQDFVKDQLQQALPSWTISRNGTIPGMSHNAGKTDMNFDVVARSPEGRYAGIEVCFQFTTNSVIERKSGQAKSRMDLLHQAGHQIAYVVDGAGNFERAAALQTICSHSDCTVAFSAPEIDVLIAYLKTLT